jgi:Alw26I/Eco31I/Esp3I family type II restriction endonuclease
MTVVEAMNQLRELKEEDSMEELFHRIFPERAEVFKTYGISQVAFEKSNNIRSGYLSPGYMCNPPDRLDGFHDYCTFCRENKDPGRSKENLRSYIHDRRVFELWSEGDWLLADVLYNSAGPGICYLCSKKLTKVSPDHIGPLSCGFKQLPLFLPTCTACNSSKNRRLFITDVKHLVEYEKRTGESVASWQVRSLWDHYKNLVVTDRDAKELSDYMRALQDFYLRTLFALFEAGYSEYLMTLLHPEFALFDIKFENLDSGKLTFDSYTKTPVTTKLRSSLPNRAIRIAFEELEIYQKKPLLDRKVRKVYMDSNANLILQLVTEAQKVELDARCKEWDRVMKSQLTKETREGRIATLRETTTPQKKYETLDKKFKKAFSHLGSSTAIPLTHSAEPETPQS